MFVTSRKAASSLRFPWRKAEFPFPASQERRVPRHLTRGNPPMNNAIAFPKPKLKLVEPEPKQPKPALFAPWKQVLRDR
jgi:hypothetical protein